MDAPADLSFADHPDADMQPVAFRVIEGSPFDEKSTAKFIAAGDVTKEVSIGEALYSASQVNEILKRGQQVVDGLRDRIEGAVIAASETQPTHKHRCTMIMAALGYDYGDPDWMMPGELRRLDAALARVAELETAIEEKAIGQEEAARLLGLSADLRNHAVTFEAEFEEKAPWCVFSLRNRAVLSSHSTRWDAIRAAAKIEAEAEEKEERL